MNKIVKFQICFVFVGLVFTLSPEAAQAWGKRGHSIVCQTAASLASASPKATFLRERSFDLAYYCNVPDVVWKNPPTYDIEAPDHFMDLEVYNRAFANSKVDKPFELDRLAFIAAFPDIKDAAGRAYWRIRELNTDLSTISDTLKRSDIAIDVRQTNQADWLVHAGTMGHYVGDLSQPLHVTENYDGNLSNQKGIHAYFEDTVVDALYAGADGKSGAQLEADIAAEALRQWPQFTKDNEQTPILALMQNLAQSSNAEIPDLLKTDLAVGRTDIKAASLAYRERIVRCMARGALVLAEIWRRQTGWDFNGAKFYTFVTAPTYLVPPQVRAPSSLKSAHKNAKKKHSH